ncbi:class I SAM-dependent methyltransferase [Oceanicaulis alexandrii]|uniref:class I SAM-dependent methyltransferase n=1 Tax=Oceanicaulis alexandrii TaxID=153233 RepID=UPI0023560B5F|nr:class I SAM-dependent methyltransferase [Oceanicaulis alexandrii]
MSVLPDRWQYSLTVLKRLQGWRERECPICGYQGRFHGSGHPPRYDSVCGGCGSRERHRLFKLAMDQRPFARGQVLHFAPDRALIPLLCELGTYQSADIRPGVADLVLDIEHIDLPDATMDLVVANQVLEHVDDIAALAEIYRILKLGGQFIATVPLVEGWAETYENPAIDSDAGRSLHFGQSDHIRYYGRDFATRLADAGFEVESFVPGGAETVRFGLMPGERIFLATRPE